MADKQSGTKAAQDESTPVQTTSSATEQVADKNAYVQQQKPATTVPEMVARLTKKNDDYVFKLRRMLKDAGTSAEQEETILKGLLPQILSAQQKGQPATALLGPVSVEVDRLLHAPKVQPKKPMWLLVTDQSLFFMAILSIVYAVMTYFNPKAQNTAGSSFMYLLLLSVMAGFFFVYYADWTKQDKKKRRSAWQVMIGGMLLVVVVTLVGGSLAYLNTPLTRPMSWPFCIVIAAITYGIHFFLQRRYQLKGFFSAS